MRLTKTQKNFRKAMQTQQPETDPYDYHRNRRKHLGGYKSGSKGGGLISLVVIVAAVIVFYHGFIKSPVPVQSFSGQPVLSESTSAYSRAMPAWQARHVQQIETALRNVDQAMQPVAQFHAQGTNSREWSSYRNSLLSAMKVCTEEKQKLSQLDSPAGLAPMLETAHAYINYTEEALVNWHDNAAQPSPSSVERGNYFSNLASQSRMQYRSAFENYLKSNHYKYTKTNSGITYWYQQ